MCLCEELVNGLSTDVIAKRKRDDLLRLRRLGIEKRRKKGPKLSDEHISSGNDDDELISEKEGDSFEFGTCYTVAISEHLY